MDAALGEYLRDLAGRLDEAKRGERGRLLDEAQRMLGWSRQTLYNRLRAAGWRSGRKRRADRGECGLDYEHLNTISALMMESRRANGKRLLSVRRALEIAYANGRIPARPHPATVLAQLRRHGLHPDQVGAAPPHQDLRSLHPNHAWEIDASVCVLYYLDSGGLAAMDRKEFYKNKPENARRVADDLCLRWVITDHYSGALYLRYYTGSGETRDMVFDFLMRAMARKPDNPMHGVPSILLADKGAANRSHLILRLLDRLRVEVIAHRAGNPRAKGQVEQAQNLIECQFEAGLFLERIRDLTHLNERADVWQHAFNACETLERHGRSRWGMWSTIRPEQLREAPPRAVCEALLSSKPETRVVKGNLVVSYKVPGHPRMSYDVRQVPGVRVGDKLAVAVNPYRAPHIDVLIEDEHGREQAWECAPRATDAAGFYLDAAVIGEHLQRPADTVADRARKEQLRLAYGTDTLAEAEAKRKRREPAFGGDIDPLAGYAEATRNLAWPDRPGTPLEVEAPRRVVLLPIPLVTACKRLIADGVPADGLYARLSARYPDGVPADDFEGLAAELRAPAPLRAVR